MDGVKEKVDPSWHKARIAARILLKARTRPLNARDKRLARRFAEDRSVENRLLEQGLCFFSATIRAAVFPYYQHG